MLSDLIADSDEEISSVTFGTGFAGITDIETGPDGNLYILTFDRGAEGLGSLYRILPVSEGGASVAPPESAPLPDTVTPPTVDEQDGVDTEEQGPEDEADGDSEDNEEEEQNENDNEE